MKFINKCAIATLGVSCIHTSCDTATAFSFITKVINTVTTSRNIQRSNDIHINFYATTLNDIESQEHYENDKNVHMNNSRNSRRVFMGQLVTSASLASFGLFGTSTGTCNCNDDMICPCTSCNKNSLFGPLPVMAFETKDEDGTQRSADYYAQVLQVCMYIL